MAALRVLLLAAALCGSAAGFVQPGPLRNDVSRERALLVSARALDVQPADESHEAAGSAWRPLALGITLGLLVAVSTCRAPAALAADLKNGQEVFNNICVACHAGGSNLVVPEKTLKKEAFKQFGVQDVTKVKAIIVGGQNAMPALGNMLSAQELDDVANYVYQQAEKGW